MLRKGGVWVGVGYQSYDLGEYNDWRWIENRIESPAIFIFLEEWAIMLDILLPLRCIHLRNLVHHSCCSISTRVEHSQAVLVRPPQFISDEKLGLETAVNDTIAWFDASPEHSKEKFEAKLKSSLLTQLPRNSIESLGQTNLP